MTLQHLLKVPFKTLVYTVSQHNKHGKFYNYYLNNVLSHDVLCAMLSHLVMSDSLWPHGLRPSRLLCPWGISRQNCRGRLPFPSPGALPNPGMDRTLPALQVDSLLLSHQGSPKWYLNIPILVELRFFFLGFPGGSAVRNLPATQEMETQVRSLGREEPLEECMATHSSVLAWRLPRKE